MRHLALAVLAVTFGCAHSVAPLDSARLAGPRPVAYALVHTAPPRVLLGDVQGSAEKGVAGDVLAKPFARGEQLPASTEARPPSGPPLHDPAELIAAVVIDRMLAEKLAAPGAAACSPGCPKGSVALKLAITRLDVFLGGALNRNAVRELDAELTLLDEQGEIWKGACSAQDVHLKLDEMTAAQSDPELADPVAISQNLQKLIDRAAKACADSVAGDLAVAAKR